jgi:hypothetical protein
MKILLLLTSVFDSIGGIHTCNRELIKATDDLMRAPMPAQFCIAS